MKMSVTRALNEVKLIDAKIEKAICNSFFVGTKSAKDKKVFENNVSEDEFVENCKSKLQSIRDLTNRRKEIKSKIVLSNADTIVEIGSVKMSKADAIERKSSIELEKMLLSKLKQDLLSAEKRIVSENEKVEKRIEKLTESYVGKETNNKELVENAEKLAKTTRESEKVDLVDPIKIRDLIEKTENEIMEFENNVDFVLSESNSITMIEIND